MAAVVVLNGGSSSGKSTIARALQRRLGPTWLVLGVDDLVRALPGGDLTDDERVTATTPGDGGIEFGADGSVITGDAFRRAEAAWYAGLAAIGASGVGLIIDEVLLGAAESQRRLAAALAGLEVVWVGIRCDADVAADRERGRGDRITGMARQQAALVHEGVAYDLVLDATSTSPGSCAAAIAAHPAVARGASP